MCDVSSTSVFFKQRTKWLLAWCYFQILLYLVIDNSYGSSHQRYMMVFYVPHIWISMLQLVYFNFFSASYFITFLLMVLLNLLVSKTLFHQGKLLCSHYTHKCVHTEIFTHCSRYIFLQFFWMGLFSVVSEVCLLEFLSNFLKIGTIICKWYPNLQYFVGKRVGFLILSFCQNFVWHLLESKMSLYPIRVSVLYI